MPVYANTPEARLGRTDSLDPATTCRGITSSGRPCRRSLVSEDAPRPSKKKHRDDPTDESQYCWQHKDQAAAAAAAAASSPPKKSHLILQQRSSIDTLAERLGLSHISSGNHDSRPTTTKPRLFSLCCCLNLSIPFDDVDPPPRPAPTPIQPSSKPGGRKSKNKVLIPPDTPPETAAKLQEELAKPISQQDEPGYIYIFWLTSESDASTPPREAARSLLAPPSSDTVRKLSDLLAAFARSGDGDADNGGAPGKKKTILLKIGRATNVQRRLNEWQRQCGYNLSLVRYYPYVPSSGGSSTRPKPSGVAAGPRKMPHSHKVERLVHIELTGRGLRVADREKCEACGREHREWFEVEATIDAVRAVDEVIKRWSDWDEALCS
ncbi:hypothetical protein VTJ83DRAFT_3775 [Remersonia thermophila]|uniref:Bacteriophage T5 Orf172 DNA-binding domain-containing protein n=1 Tax=Remersonia thermophila TaxID=72144 RepID=A0ABR4DF38_9PEZI